MPLRRQQKADFYPVLYKIGFQGWKPIELNRTVGLGIGPGGKPVETVADGQVQRQFVFIIFIQDVCAVTGRTGQDDFFHLAFSAGIDRVFNGLAHGFNQAREFPDICVYPPVQGCSGLSGDQYDLADQDAGVTDQ